MSSFVRTTAPSDIAVADFDVDGNIDLSATDEMTNVFRFFPGKGDATFGLAHSFPTSTSPEAIGIADFNGDKKPDVAVANAGAQSISVLINTSK
jgi:hypothetical protein